MSHVSGPNTAYDRLRRSGENSTSRSSGIMYPSDTNDRGSGGRERHASGDTVGGIVTKNRAHAIAQIRNETGRAKHAAGDKVEAHKFGSGIKGDFMELGHSIKKGFKNKIENPARKGFKEKIENPARKGFDKAGDKLRDFGSDVKHGAKHAMSKTREAGNTAGAVARSLGKDIKKGFNKLAHEGKKEHESEHRFGDSVRKTFGSGKDWKESGKRMRESFKPLSVK